MEDQFAAAAALRIKHEQRRCQANAGTGGADGLAGLDGAEQRRAGVLEIKELQVVAFDQRLENGRDLPAAVKRRGIDEHARADFIAAAILNDEIVLQRDIALRHRHRQLGVYGLAVVAEENAGGAADGVLEDQREAHAGAVGDGLDAL